VRGFSQAMMFLQTPADMTPSVSLDDFQLEASDWQILSRKALKVYIN